MYGRLPKKAAVSASLVLAVALCVATAAPAGAQTTAPTRATAKEKARAKVKAAAPLDLNKASAEELQESLPGVGEVTARKIVAGRPYATVDDLTRAGVPARTVEQIRPLVTVTPPVGARVKTAPKASTTAKGDAPPSLTPAPKVDLNTATLAQLESLPGVGPAHARDIIAARPFRSVDDLERVKGLGKARIDALRDKIVLSTPNPAAVPPTTTATAKDVTRPAAKSTTTTTPRTEVPPKEATKARTTARAKAAPTRPVNLNTASKEELDALPGIGPVKAQAIVEYRQAQPFRTKEDVMKVKGIKEGEFAKIRDIITVD